MSNEIIPPESLSFRMIEKFIRDKGITGKILQIECIQKKFQTNDFLYRAGIENENSGYDYFVQISNGVVVYSQPGDEKRTVLDPIFGSNTGKPQTVSPSAEEMNAVKRIVKYFADLKYPKIAGAPKLVFVHDLGFVHLVDFENIFDTRKPCYSCYAVTVNGVVSGYNEDFWSDADKYRLVLKQHLGLLAMEKADRPHEKAEPTGPVGHEGAVGETGRDTSVVGVKPSTIDSVVEMCEIQIDALKNFLEKTLNDHDDSLGQEKVRRMAAEEKLKGIQDVLSGKKETTEKPSEPTPEECMINQGSADPFDSDNNIDIGVTTPIIGNSGRTGDYATIPNQPYKTIG